MISLDDIYYKDEEGDEKLLPGYVKHFSKTKSIDDIIDHIISEDNSF